MDYIDFEDGKVVPAKPIPKIYQKSFDKYCKKVEAANRRKQEMFDNITKQLEDGENN